ncbi:unnamed protein product [Microthlaspi erraticum]|uniref:Uncharacterized protein n=1 Tax=Microthlaspi erraticum TaxID=1685480 RepID=A0A6D2I7P6_9BRAS|nr:unnamed protein product [Microthlaspi erraticum]
MLATCLIRIKLDRKPVMFSHTVEPRSLAFPKTNIGCNVFKLCGNHCSHEACRECVWLRSLIQHIQEASGVSTKKEPTTIYEDNSACVTQLKEGYIKSDRTKHIPPRFFSYTQELEKNQEVDIQYVRSSDNAADLFTKALPTTVFKKHVQVLECVVYKICEEKTISIFRGSLCCGTLFPFHGFYPIGFFHVKVLKRPYATS